MKIGFLGDGFPEGKIKYEDSRLAALGEKFSPAKVTPFFVEFARDDFLACDSILLSREKALDLFILDMEKIEKRLENTDDEKEKEILQESLSSLEKEIPLCDVNFDEAELAILKESGLFSLKPTLIAEAQMEESKLIEEILKKSNIIFFYTAIKKEVKSWAVEKDLDVVSCAGKIHSDLARGFIKAEVVNFSDLLNVHNLHEAKTKGLVKLVDRDYKVKDGDILEIRFNV